MKKLLLCLSLATLIFAGGCSDDDDDNNGGDNFFEGDQLQGDITQDVSLDASVTYTLTGILSVKTGATLTIPAGTMIKAKGGATAFYQYVVVEQGGKIMAEGTAEKPITFTSGVANPAPGDWGGLIINGYAPISGATSGTTGTTEIDEDLPYGGTKADDNSGVLKYVILSYTGARSTADIEHNGLTLDAVGSGTTIENIYVPYTSDDGVEFFGGSVTVKNMLVVDSDDDMFDNTQGWTGTLDNAYGIWTTNRPSSTESDPRGIESDGNLDGNGPDHVDQSNYMMKNITIVNNSTYTMNDCVKIRRGATATITNLLIKNGSTGDVIDITDSKGLGNDATNINFTATNVTYTDNEINREYHVKDALGNPTGEVWTSNATITSSTTNTGANTSVFGWTGYIFPSN